LIVIVSFLNSCYAPGSPSAVVKNAFAAAEKGDWDKFYEFSVTSIDDVLWDKDYSRIGNSLAQDIMQGFLYSHDSLKNIISETIDGDQATVTASFKKGNDYDLKLIKHEGKWKIHFQYNFK